MTEQERKQMVREIRNTYPDCPQRDIALDLLRKGRVEQARSWLEALDQLKQRGEADLFPTRGQKAQRSA